MKIDKDFLVEVSNSLEEMITYADDGNCDRRDETFKEYFDSLDSARFILEKLNNMIWSDNNE